MQGPEYGTDGAIVLLHDIPAGAFVWADIMPQLASLNRAVYAIDMLGYGQSDHPWPADTSNWGHADGLNMLFEQLNLTKLYPGGTWFGWKRSTSAGYAFVQGACGGISAHR